MVKVHPCQLIKRTIQSGQLKLVVANVGLSGPIQPKTFLFEQQTKETVLMGYTLNNISHYINKEHQSRSS